MSQPAEEIEMSVEVEESIKFRPGQLAAIRDRVYAVGGSDASAFTEADVLRQRLERGSRSHLPAGFEQSI